MDKHGGVGVSARRCQGVDLSLSFTRGRPVAVSVHIQILHPGRETLLVAVSGGEEQFTALIAVLFGREKSGELRVVFRQEFAREAVNLPGFLVAAVAAPGTKWLQARFINPCRYCVNNSLHFSGIGGKISARRRF